jgi:hypothetical protein
MRTTYNISVGEMKERNNTEDLITDVRIIIECNAEYENVNWIRLAKDAVQERAFFNKVMILRVP